jgi:hypothetical protein
MDRLGLVRITGCAPASDRSAYRTRLWEPWIAWAYGAGFDRRTEEHIPEAGLELAEARFVVNDLVRLISARAAS